jgi:hypothetical protein
MELMMVRQCSFYSIGDCFVCRHVIYDQYCCVACRHVADKLRQYFEVFGAVQDAVVMKDPVSRRSRGFGFITFERASYVDKALDQDVHTIDSRKVR